MQGMHYFESFGCIFFSQFKFLFLQVYCAQVCIRGDPCGLPSLEPGFQQVPHLGTVKRFFDLVIVLELLKFICLQSVRQIPQTVSSTLGQKLKFEALLLEVSKGRLYLTKHLKEAFFVWLLEILFLSLFVKALKHTVGLHSLSPLFDFATLEANQIHESKVECIQSNFVLLQLF